MARVPEVAGGIHCRPSFLPDQICYVIKNTQGRGVHVTGVSAAYTFKLNKNILSE
jgi:hypothetical protein